MSIKAICQSHLPSWRKNINYQESNSARKKYGGGALLELSHEIDYIQWILSGNLNLNFASLRRISNLKIDTEDDVSIFGKIRKTDKGKKKKSSFFPWQNTISSINNQSIIIINLS